MKTSATALFLYAAVNATMAIAQSGIPQSGKPFNALQEQIDLLDARLGALEDVAHAPPSASVEGRTYCAQLTTVNFLGAPQLSIDSDRLDISRFEVTFNGGVVSGTGISGWRGSQNQNGEINLIQDPLGPPGPLFGQTYIQNGRRIDLMVGPAPWTLYVSADGSVIHGNRIFRISPGQFEVVGLSTISYVEDAVGAGCNPEYFPANQSF